METLVDEREARAERIRTSLRLNAEEIADLEQRLDKKRAQRRQIVLLGREDGAVTYEQMAADAGITKSAVYKIVRDGFHEPPVAEWKDQPE